MKYKKYTRIQFRYFEGDLALNFDTWNVSLSAQEFNIRTRKFVFRLIWVMN